MTPARVTIDELTLADTPARWSTLGFDVEQDCVQLGTVRLRLVGEDAGRGIVRWSLRGLSSTELDGLATVRSDSTVPAPAPIHPNGVVAIDHVVAMSPALDRSVQALQAAGLDLRRIRDEPTPAGAPRQAFFRLGAEILEVVQVPEQAIERSGGPDSPARLWGLALIVADLDRTVAALGEHVSEARAAVQERRRIATVKRSAGLGVAVAIISSRT
jgi:hypothetical protein